MNEITAFTAVLLSIGTPIGAALWRIIVWAKPHVEGMITDLRNLIANLSDQHEILERLATANSVQMDLIAAQNRQITQGRWLTLIVDDSSISRKLLLKICAEVAADIKLIVKDVSSLHDAYEHLPFCRLVILDVLMHDCDAERAQAFINAAAPCPVIIYSDVPEEFSNTAGRLRKTDEFQAQVAVIRSVLARAVI